MTPGAIPSGVAGVGASNQETPGKNRKTLARTKAMERKGRAAGSGDTKTKRALYEDAKRRDVRGRSTMSKDQLERALHG